MGATVIATSSTDAKLEEAKKLGAAELINYNNHPKWESEVLRLTKGRGVDLVSDVGGSSTVEQSIVSLRQGGTACLIGFLTPPKDTDIVFLLIKEARICKFFSHFGFSSSLDNNKSSFGRNKLVRPCLPSSIQASVRVCLIEDERGDPKPLIKDEIDKPALGESYSTSRSCQVFKCKKRPNRLTDFSQQ